MRHLTLNLALIAGALLCSAGCKEKDRVETGIGRISTDLAMDSLLLEVERLLVCALAGFPALQSAASRSLVASAIVEDYQAACALLTGAVEGATLTWHVVDSLGAMPDSLHAFQLTIRLEIPEEGTSRSRLSETTVGPFLRPALCDSLETAAHAAGLATRRCQPWVGFLESLDRARPQGERRR